MTYLKEFYDLSLRFVRAFERAATAMERNVALTADLLENQKRIAAAQERGAQASEQWNEDERQRTGVAVPKGNG